MSCCCVLICEYSGGEGVIVIGSPVGWFDCPKTTSSLSFVGVIDCVIDAALPLYPVEGIIVSTAPHALPGTAKPLTDIVPDAAVHVTVTLVPAGTAAVCPPPGPPVAPGQRNAKSSGEVVATAPS